MSYTHVRIINFAQVSIGCFAALLLLLMAHTTQAGPLDIVWEKSDGDFTSVTLESVAAMQDGGLLLGGSITSKTLPWDSRLAYLIRTDADGRKLWTQAFPRPTGGGYIPRSSIADLFATEDGGIFCHEKFFANSFFNPLGAYVDFVIKCDASGNREWERSYGSGFLVNGIAPAADNGCAVVGSYSDGYSRYRFIARLDALGATVWEKQWNVEPYLIITKFSSSADNGFFLGGYRSIGTVNVARIIKVDFLGNFLWDKTFQYGENTSTTPGGGIIGTPDGGCMIGGSTRGDAGTGPYFLKLDSNGEKEWEYVWSDPSAASVLSMQRTRNGDFLCLGTRTVFDPEQGATIPQSVTLTLVAAPGEIRWQREYEFPSSLTWASRLFITSDRSYGFLGTQGGTLGYDRPFLVKISTQAKAAIWGRYGMDPMATALVLATGPDAARPPAQRGAPSGQ